MTEAPAIELIEVAKALGRQPILRQITLRVAYGEIAGIMGPNGSGKSLLLRIMSGLAYADAGTVHIGGRPLRAAWNGPLAPCRECGRHTMRGIQIFPCLMG